MMIIVMLSYTRSHFRSRITIVWSIYLKACGLSARAFDALHSLGITMSHKWTANAIGKLSHDAMERMKKDVRRLRWMISHDNMNLPMRVFSQRLNNKSMFISATAATIWVLPKEATLPDDINSQYQKQQRKGAEKPFNAFSYTTSSPAALARSKRLRLQAVSRILRFLLDHPDFKEYPHRTDPMLQPPPPVKLLPCGEKYITRQHILQTVQVDESSYDGTDELVNREFRTQMGFTSAVDIVIIGLKWVLAWIGDQLTVDRIRGLAKQRYDEPNSYLRMDWVIPIFGWFHLLMAFANSLHSQYLGTSAGMGLRRAFEVLGRKYLLKQETKGPFWHHLDEALWHIGEARFLACWLQETGAAELSQLQQKSPKELSELASTIYKKYASRETHTKLVLRPQEKQDEVYQQLILFGADVLSYFDLREAMQVGDVGRMEDLLSTLLLRFAGGSNPKYRDEILELIQAFEAPEYPPALR